eukprot:9166-Pelagococcus_subviridis.AAC.3
MDGRRFPRYFSAFDVTSRTDRVWILDDRRIREISRSSLLRELKSINLSRLAGWLGREKNRTKRRTPSTPSRADRSHNTSWMDPHPIKLPHHQPPSELFQQVGAVKKAGLNFDENGRSKGTAEIIFASPASAQKAIQTYNGVKLDGRPLKIELIGGGGGLGGSLAGRLSGVGAGGRTVTFNAGRGGSGVRGGRKVVAKVVSAPRGKKGAAGGAKGAGGRGAKGGGRGGKGGRGPKPKKATPMTQEQLDAQLDSYKAGAAAAPAGDVAMME